MTSRCRRRSRSSTSSSSRTRRVRGERGSARRGARHRHRLDQAAHRVRRAGAALGAGRSARRTAPALTGAGAGRALDRRAPARRAGADRRNAGVYRGEPAGGDAAAQYSHRQSCRRPGVGARARRAAFWQRGVAVEQRGLRSERSARRGARPRHAQLQARAEDRREPGVRYRPGAARRAGHERGIGAQDPGDREGDVRAARRRRADDRSCSAAARRC